MFSFKECAISLIGKNNIKYTYLRNIVDVKFSRNKNQDISISIDDYCTLKCLNIYGYKDNIWKLSLKNLDYSYEFLKNIIPESLGKDFDEIVIPNIPLNIQKKVIEISCLIKDINKEYQDFSYLINEQKLDLLKNKFDFYKKKVKYVKLKDVCRIIEGKDIPKIKATNTNDVVYYIYSNILSRDFNELEISKQNAINSGLEILKKNTLIFNLKSTTNLIKKIDKETVLSSDFCGLILDETKIREEFLLNNILYINNIAKIKNISDLENFIIPLPSIKEQDEILLEYNKELNQINSNFTDLSNITKDKYIYAINTLCNLNNITEVPKMKLSDICYFHQGEDLAVLKQNTVGSIVPLFRAEYITYGNINSNIVVCASKYLAPDNIIMSLEGNTIGQIAINKKEGCIDNSCCAFNKKETDVNTIYLFYVLMSKINEIKDLIKNNKLNIKDIENIEISLPIIQYQQYVSEALVKYNKIYQFH